MRVKSTKKAGRPRRFDQMVAVRLSRRLVAILDREVMRKRRAGTTELVTRADIIRMCIQAKLGS